MDGAHRRLALRLVLLSAALVSLAGATGATAATGDLVFEECFANEGNEGCADLGPDPLSSAEDVVVSPDGNHVYVAAEGFIHFTRDGNGSLAFHDCVSDVPGTGCTDPNPAEDQLFDLDNRSWRYEPVRRFEL